jgi:hypothetical protein
MDAGTKSSLPGEFPHDYDNVDWFMAHTSLLEVHQTWCVLLAGEFQFEAGDAGCAKPWRILPASITVQFVMGKIHPLVQQRFEFHPTRAFRKLTAKS